MIVTVIVTAILYSSLVEYSLHRWYLHHDITHPHIKNHHRIFHGKNTYQSTDIPNGEIVSDIRYILVNIGLAIPIAVLIMLKAQFSMGLIFLIISTAYTIWVEIAHLNFHRPNASSLKKYRWFLHIMELHRKHHTTYIHHFGIGSSWWDYLLSTNQKNDQISHSS